METVALTGGCFREMLPPDWRDLVAHTENWKREFGPPESPVVVAAIAPQTVAVCDALRDLFAGRRRRIFVVGPAGSGKSVFLAALIAEAEERGIPITTVPAGNNPTDLPLKLARGKVKLLGVYALDRLSQSIRSAIIDNRAMINMGLFAAAEQLSAVTLASLTEDDDVVVVIPPLEERGADVLVLAQLLWPSVCGAESDLLANCLDGAVDNLCRGPYAEGAASLRVTLEQLADALIASGDLVGGEFRRCVEAQDVNHAVLAAIRARIPASFSASVSAVVIVEGSTDLTYLTRAAQLAEAELGWRLLDGCDIRSAGEGRSGGAKAVWLRLLELVGNSVECVGLFDNDDVGRKESNSGKNLGLQVELLPAGFDRLNLAPDQRTVEVEDLLTIELLDRFYDQHADLEPEEIRWRAGGLWRVVPRGEDKECLANWAAEQMQLKDCSRLLYVLCVVRKRLGLPIPREDLDTWRATLVDARSDAPTRVISHVTGLRIHGSGLAEEQVTTPDT
jgi:hypothetical protein